MRSPFLYHLCTRHGNKVGLGRTWFNHDGIAGGGILRFEMCASSPGR